MAIVKDLTVLGPSRFLGDGEFDTIEAISFKKRGSSASYVLLGDGTHKPLSELSASTHDHDAVYAKKDGSNIAANTSWANLSVGGSAGSLSAIIANDKLPERLRQYITTEVTAEANGFGRITSGGPFTFLNTSAVDCMLVSTAYSSNWAAQLALDYRSNNLAVRNKNSGTWNEWAYFLPTIMATTSLTDCNSVNSTGIWTKSNFSNKPTGVTDWGSLFNIRLYTSNNNYHRQLFFDCYGSDKIWTRSDNNGTWTIWKELLNSSNYHSRFITTGSTSYIKIKINSTTTWMISFLVRVYQGYNSYDIVFSGYQYGSHHWYRPQAILQSSTNTSIKVYFGYESNNNLFVVISGGSYTGVEILNATNGYTEITDKSTIGDLFTITNSSSLPSTIQTTDESGVLQSVCDSTGAVTIYRPWYRNETVTNATNATNAGNATNADNANKAYTIYSGITSTSDAPGKFTVNIDGIDTLYDGLTIHVKLSKDYYGVSGGTGAGYNTLNVNSLGAKLIWYRNGTIATSHFRTNAEVTLTYRSSAGSYTVSNTAGGLSAGTYTDGWIATWAYYGDSDYRAMQYYFRYKIYSNSSDTTKNGYLGRYMVVMECPNGTITGLCKTNNAATSTTKTMFSGPLLLNKVYYYGHTDTFNQDAIMTRDAYIHGNINLFEPRYTFNCNTSLTANKPFFIVGTIGSDGYFYLDNSTATSCYAQDYPTTDNGKVYILVGVAYDNYRVNLEMYNPAYVFKNGKLQKYTEYAANAGGLSQSTITSLSSFTHDTNLIYSSAGGSNSIGDKPTGVDAFGVISLKNASGWYGQILMSSNTGNGIYWRNGTTLSGGWHKLLDSNNYTNYVGSGKFVLQNNSGSTFNTLFTANSSTDTTGIKFLNGTNTTVDVVAATSSTPATVKYSVSGITSANSGTMQISANGGTAVNTLFNANSSSATNAINFKAGDNVSIEVTAASGTTPAAVKISSTGGTSGNYVQYTSESNHVEKITVATSPGNNANTLYIIL